MSWQAAACGVIPGRTQPFGQHHPLERRTGGLPTTPLANQMTTKAKWIFFDLGWTLVDETGAHRARLEQTRDHLASWGHAYSVEELIGLCERAATRFAPSPFRGMLANLGLPADQVKVVTQSARYPKKLEVLYPGVPALLATLAEHFKVGVIANQSEGTERRLSDWSIREFFSIIFASSECGLSKPDSRIFAEAQAVAQCRPEEAVMVGDRIDNDIGPAKAQGWKTVRVLQGFSRLQRPRGPSEKPDITITEIRALSEALSTS